MTDKIKLIEPTEIEKASISSLPTRPNAPSAMGGIGMSSQDLRKRFDALAMLAINKINAVLKSLNGEVGATPFAKYIQTTLGNGEGGTYTLYEVLEWLQSNDFAEKIILSEDYTLADFYAEFKSMPSLDKVEEVEHHDYEEALIAIHEGGILYSSKLRFIFDKTCSKPLLEIPNEMQIPIVQGGHIEFVSDGKVVGISAIVDQSFNANSTEAQSGKAVSGAIKPLSDSIDQMQNKISSLEAQVDLYPLFTFHSNQNMEAIVSGYIDTISFNRVVDGKTEEVFNKEPSVGDIFFAYGQSADGVRFHMTAVITAIDDTDNPSQATFKALEVYEDAGEGAIAIDPNYDSTSLNAQSGKAVGEAVAGVQKQIPLVLPYIFEWGKNAEITKGEINTVAAMYFNRTPKEEDHFFGYFYIEVEENKEITHKDYHVSAKVLHVPENVQPDNAITFEVLEAVQYIPTVNQQYDPDSENAQSGKAVSQAVQEAKTYTDQQVASLGGVPDFIISEAERVAKNVQATRTAKSLVFSAMSDMHIYAGNDSDTHIRSILSATYAGQGVEELQKRMHLDFAAYLGDFTWGASNCTVEQLMKDITLFKGTTATTEKEVWCVGNHDTNYGKDRDRRMTTDEQYAYIGANSDGVKPYENIDRCYGYLDFENQKIRVVYLNTADTSDWDAQDGEAATEHWISPTQIQWIADTVLNFSDKTTPSEWGIVFISHHPMHYPNYGSQNTMKLLEAYKAGQSGSIQCIVSADITESGAYENQVYKTVTYDFSSGEKAEIICNIHGHNHNCGTLVASSSTVFGQTGIEPWLVCIGIPNLCVTRENGGASLNEYWGTNLGEFDKNGNPVYWTKEIGNAKATSFCVINIDRKTQKIYAHIFGAGRDRFISYVDGSIEGEEPDTPSYTNLADPNADGWVNNSRIGSDGTAKEEGAFAGGVVTNYIHIPDRTKKLYTKGINIANATSDGAATSRYSLNGDGTYTYINRTYPEASKITVSGDVTEWNISVNVLNGEYIRVSGKLLDGYTAKDVVITLGEPIE